MDQVNQLCFLGKMHDFSTLLKSRFNFLIIKAKTTRLMIDTFTITIYRVLIYNYKNLKTLF